MKPSLGNAILAATLDAMGNHLADELKTSDRVAVRVDFAPGPAPTCIRLLPPGLEKHIGYRWNFADQPIEFQHGGKVVAGWIAENCLSVTEEGLFLKELVWMPGVAAAIEAGDYTCLFFHLRRPSQTASFTLGAVQLGAMPKGEIGGAPCAPEDSAKAALALMPASDRRRLLLDLLAGEFDL